MLSQVTLQEINYGLTNCTWSSCREGCTAEFFKCHHIRVSYTPQIEYDEEQGGLVTDFEKEDWEMALGSYEEAIRLEVEKIKSEKGERSWENLSFYHKNLGLALYH